jgi:hypothetical protein
MKDKLNELDLLLTAAIDPLEDYILELPKSEFANECPEFKEALLNRLNAAADSLFESFLLVNGALMALDSGSWGDFLSALESENEP